jgi:hypothetical protein
MTVNTTMCYYQYTLHTYQSMRVNNFITVSIQFSPGRKHIDCEKNNWF